ncbi:HNH endonuclease [Marinomonas fungiae]|uniref:HNH endonuclease n=1 Tax=Marinomonas fungiae TaxID=1137284 RepID=A0A0K6IM41_9GAMM|nr:HNH endonuclease [Marinomonas fungiae]CUB04180.1 HNH endonuclease [Marinomonas fungiae]
MKLDVDFSALDMAVKKMGAQSIKIEFTDEIIPIEPIDKQLDEGIEVNFQEIDFDTGLASYQGRQVLLYIKDHSYGNKIHSVIKDGSKGNRFHIAECQKLAEMRRAGRFERYVVTNRIDGVFSVSGMDTIVNQLVEGEAQLNVCQYCLESINYKKFASLPRGIARRDFVKIFNMADFFDTYSSFFKFMPSGIAEKSSNAYSDDWEVISKKIREQVNYQCQQCGLDLSFNKRLLHVHHVNGVKSDNSETNLRALCCDCHRKQPNHNHMFVPHEQTQQINHLRKEQGINFKENWRDVYDLADPGMHGVIDLLERYQVHLPAVGEEVQNQGGRVIAELELAWPLKKVGVAVDKEDAVQATKFGWKVYSMRHALSQIDDLVARVR